jgi:hypothetical protein
MKAVVKAKREPGLCLEEVPAPNKKPPRESVAASLL